ncbi:pilus biosynthesis protein TadE [Agaricicola taiwanensis]|uniref:Pilus biosynthesis protein TadE n=1 Tax=Agaricicola taiwanensis TaxID=591372 RepID=A0A8J2VN80_9RHOB|nr:TadE/TadG family type IV pilus assembly protein [Agaricicola taiwanensis]GGE33133.1 pilus biosynthesis protein TadE [Agaricicola taiwanensis]
MRIKRQKNLAVAARALGQDTEGATAVEFALVSVPFFALIFAIIETALVFFAGQLLESATADASRLILTGQAQGQDQSWFKEQICERTIDLFGEDCAGLQVDVQVLGSFTPPSGPPRDEDGNPDSSGFGYNPGNGGDIVLVRVMYEWPVYVSLMGFNLADLPNGNRLLMATSAFRNEPFGTPVAAN